MRNKGIFYIIASTALVCSCGTVKTIEETYSQPALPSQEEALEIAGSIAGGDGTVIAVETAAGPRIYRFAPAASAEEINVTTIGPEKDGWAMLNTVAYPCFQEAGLGFKEFTSPASLQEINGTGYIMFGTLRDKDRMAERSTILYDPATDNLEYVSFCGKYLSDGRIEGRSNLEFISNGSRPEILWAESLFAQDPELVVLSEADILTDQAIEWWLKNNPSAQTSATKVSFGTLPAESSLVNLFRSAKKQTSTAFNTALFNIRGYTVIVGQRKSNGNWLLLWAEPVCKNKNTDNYLNNIYFRGDNTLVLFYYKGKKTFNYQINLSNSRLMR